MRRVIFLPIKQAFRPVTRGMLLMKLDTEWIQLINEAKRLGISIED
ncbi:DNA-binding anti-repressor SinI, partial [Bacillus sp. CRN 9]|nr:DNA-binding anti-repressor SinI [Bacillus sp. CRN 9]